MNVQIQERFVNYMLEVFNVPSLYQVGMLTISAVLFIVAICVAFWPRRPIIMWHVPEGTKDFLIPRKGTPGAMAWDLVSPTDAEVPAAGDGGVGKTVINTLVAATIPKGYALMLGSRSSMAGKRYITVEAGWVDNDYRGLMRVVLYNHSTTAYKINAGERIAQAMLVPVINVREDTVWQYPNANETQRGTGGFGSTGK
jgi:dUTP pyrophosphatase